MLQITWHNYSYLVTVCWIMDKLITIIHNATLAGKHKGGEGGSTLWLSGWETDISMGNTMHMLLQHHEKAYVSGFVVIALHQASGLKMKREKLSLGIYRKAHNI